MNFFPLAGATLGLLLGLLISRGGGLLSLIILGAALGWLLQLAARREA